MTATLVCPSNIPPEAAAGSGDSSLSNGGFEASYLDHAVKPGKEEDIDDENDIEIEDKAHSSSAHTDDEIDEEDIKDARISNSKKVRIKCNNNDDNNNTDGVGLHIHIEDTKIAENKDGSVGGAPPKPLSSILKATSAPPLVNRSPHWSERGSWKGRDSCEDTSDTDNQNNNQESYASYKIGRKNLLKIERLTDSDSRGRQKMRSRALSPPSSSDEENLHIGWVAYPIVQPVLNRRRKGRFRQKPVCTCVNAIKTIFSPVTKICLLCRTNKVGTSQTSILSHGPGVAGNGLV